MVKRKLLQSDDELQTLEEHLAVTLKPVQPPSDLVVRLRERIRFPQRSEIVYQFGDWKRLFLALGGVMSALLAAITLARALFYFFGRRDI